MVTTNKNFFLKLTAFIITLLTLLFLTISTALATTTAAGPNLVSTSSNSFKVNAIFPKSGAYGNKLQFMNTTTGKWYDFYGVKQNYAQNGVYTATELFSGTKYLVRLTYLLNNKSQVKDIYVITITQKNTTSTSVKTSTPAKPLITNNIVVYWTDGGKSYHLRKDCSTLTRSTNIKSGPKSMCPKTDPCDKCAK